MFKANLTVGGSQMLHIGNASSLAAYLLSKAPDKSLDRFKLMRLMYFADRECLAQTGFSITLDTYLSTEDGIVLSDTDDIIAGVTPTPQAWDKLITTDGLICSLRADITEPVRMSEFNEGLVNELWAKYGDKTAEELRDLTHSLPEWQAPNGSPVPVRIKTILQNFDDFTTEAAEHFDEEHYVLRLELSYFKACG